MSLDGAPRGPSRRAPTWIYQSCNGHFLFFLLDLKRSPIFVAAKNSSEGLVGPGFVGVSSDNLAAVSDNYFHLTEAKAKVAKKRSHVV